MRKFTSIKIEKRAGATTLWLSRPEAKNALNLQMATEIIEALQEISTNGSRMLIIRGEDNLFSAGADLHWMLNDTLPVEQQIQTLLPKVLFSIYELNIPVLCIIERFALGGAIGLASVCDYIYAEAETTFSLPEVSLGLVPAVILPFLLSRGHAPAIRQLALSAQKIKAAQAVRHGLADFIFKKGDEKDIEQLITVLMQNAPEATGKTKALIRSLHTERINEEIQRSGGILDEIRKSKEAAEGISAFFEKRTPSWVHKHEQNDE